jgi:hypothetical protein
VERKEWFKMGVQKRYQAIVLGILLAYTIGISVGRRESALYGTAGADPAGHVSVKAYRDGELFYEFDDHNLITTIGSTHIRDFMGWANQSNVACIHLSLSNDGAPQTSWVKLPAEIIGGGLNLDRATGAQTALNATAYQVTYTWTAGASATVQCTGLHWDSTGDSSGNLLAAAQISSVSLQANDMLQVTWTVNIPDG